MCALWSGESRCRPSQQLGAWNRTLSWLPGVQLAGMSHCRVRSPHSKPSTAPGWFLNWSSVEDGLHLDSPDHQAHMAYPVVGVCPSSHPVAVNMIEFKMAWPVSGDMSQVHFSSGRGYSFHYDVFNAWDVPTLAALTTHCINGGLQCDPRGFDQYKPDRGAALNENYELP